MNTAVVILNYNTWQDTLACAESVLASHTPPTWLLLVDNASTNDAVHWIRRWAAGELEGMLPELGAPTSAAKPLALTDIRTGEACPKPAPGSVMLLRNPSNRGYAAGNNAGLAMALRWGADAVWILNNDTVVEPHALGAMRERLFSCRRPGLCGSLVVYMENRNIVQCRAGGVTNIWTGLSALNGQGLTLEAARAASPACIEKKINFIYGASVMVSRQFLDTVGLMDERYFLYCEEQDWAYSAKGRFDLAYAPGAVVYHREGGCTGLSYKKYTLKALLRLTRSRLLVTWKHHMYALPTVCLSLGFAAARMVWRRLRMR